jgi:hypothetical protein
VIYYNCLFSASYLIVAETVISRPDASQLKQPGIKTILHRSLRWSDKDSQLKQPGIKTQSPALSAVFEFILPKN